MFKKVTSKRDDLIWKMQQMNIAVTSQEKIDNLLTVGIKTGSTVFGSQFEDYTDIDIVFPCKDVNVMFDNAVKKGWYYIGDGGYNNDSWTTKNIYGYTADSKVYNIIFAEEETFQDWKFATERMLADIAESQYFKCYYSTKENRVRQFGVYRSLSEFMRTDIPF